MAMILQVEGAGAYRFTGALRWLCEVSSFTLGRWVLGVESGKPKFQSGDDGDGSAGGRRWCLHQISQRGVSADALLQFAPAVLLGLFLCVDGLPWGCLTQWPMTSDNSAYDESNVFNVEG